MQITVAQLSKIAGKPANANMRSIVAGLDAMGVKVGLDKPHRLAQYIAQVGHESGGFTYDKELWGPTVAQKRYDTRTDLGNTAAVDGDGFLYRGRTSMQATGKANYIAFRDWCIAQGLPNVPDFEKNPDAINTDPWEGIFPIYFWTTRRLNDYADTADIEQITKKINGGLNGYADRLNWYTRTALVLAGYGPEAVKSFQIDAQRAGMLPADEPGKPTQIDGDVGAKTRSALHMTLAAAAPRTDVKAAPVTEETQVPVPVAPQGADKTLMSRVTSATAAVAPIAAYAAPFDPMIKLALLGVGVLAVGVLLWKAELIAARVRTVVALFDQEPIR